MAEIIRVKTLSLPFQDDLASFILSCPSFEILVNERTVLKNGGITMHLEYLDRSGLTDEQFMQVVKDLRENVDVKDELDLLGMGESFGDDEEYVPAELVDTPAEGKSKKKRRKKGEEA